MRTRILRLSALQDVAVFIPGDLHDLGMFALKVFDIRDREANAANLGVIIGPSRPTLHGLAVHYAQLTNTDLRRVEGMLVAAGFDLGAIVELDTADAANETRSQPRG